jgi:lipooligosaccharide transport system permease protein
MTAVLPLRGVPSLRMTERNALVYLRLWYMFVSGFFEPFFYLLSIGVGVGKLVGGIEYHGHEIAYASFVAPGMMASAAMNGAVFDATFAIFFKLKYTGLYSAVVATPTTANQIAIGEIAWSLVRGGSYAIAFLASMTLLGYTESWWALLAVPVAMLVGFAFSAVGMALTSFMRTWHHFDFINLALIPLFLFSATFYPLSVYPRALQLVVQLSPLYHGVALTRAAALGELGPGLLVHVAFLAGVGALGLAVTGRRFERLLLT